MHMQKPSWLRQRLPSGPDYEKVRSLIHRDGLHTVCQEANCPNQFECFSNHTATFLIMGSHCTRNCRFCNIKTGLVDPPDPGEPERVAEAAAKMKLKYVVVTSVTRDDIPDGGASIFAATIRRIHQRLPEAVVEVLIPDFQGDRDALEKVLEAEPQVLNHNIETVARLYPKVRPEAKYRRSLALLKHVHSMTPHIPAKSGLMLGLGETEAETSATILDLFNHGCRILTLGQYLQPSTAHLAVERFIPPSEFEQWRQRALAIGFLEVASGPFVRSSYHAKEIFETMGSR
jgi:lipoic acid synthetase